MGDALGAGNEGFMREEEAASSRFEAHGRDQRRACDPEDVKSRALKKTAMLYRRRGIFKI